MCIGGGCRSLERKDIRLTRTILIIWSRVVRANTNIRVKKSGQTVDNEESEESEESEDNEDNEDSEEIEVNRYQSLKRIKGEAVAKADTKESVVDQTKSEGARDRGMWIENVINK
jgi:hypothetical protein